MSDMIKNRQEKLVNDIKEKSAIVFQFDVTKSTDMSELYKKYLTAHSAEYSGKTLISIRNSFNHLINTPNSDIKGKPKIISFLFMTDTESFDIVITFNLSNDEYLKVEIDVYDPLNVDENDKPIIVESELHLIYSLYNNDKDILDITLNRNNEVIFRQETSLPYISYIIDMSLEIPKLVYISIARFFEFISAEKYDDFNEFINWVLDKATQLNIPILIGSCGKYYANDGYHIDKITDNNSTITYQDGKTRYISTNITISDDLIASSADMKNIKEIKKGDILYTTDGGMVEVTNVIRNKTPEVYSFEDLYNTLLGLNISADESVNIASYTNPHISLDISKKNGFYQFTIYTGPLQKFHIFDMKFFNKIITIKTKQSERDYSIYNNVFNSFLYQGKFYDGNDDFNLYNHYTSIISQLLYKNKGE